MLYLHYTHRIYFVKGKPPLGGSGGFRFGPWTSTPSLPFRIADGGRIVKRENGAPAEMAGAPFRELEALLIRISDSN